jgi:hypothetical protein
MHIRPRRPPFFIALRTMATLPITSAARVFTIMVCAVHIAAAATQVSPCSAPGVQLPARVKGYVTSVAGYVTAIVVAWGNGWTAVLTKP